MDTIQVYRFKFSPLFQEKMTYFAIKHKHDSKENFKECWKQWCSMNEESIEYETRILVNKGFKGNVIDKMYKSVRYYLKHKSIDDLDTQKETILNKEKKQNVRQYIKVPEYMLLHMDTFIKENGFNDKPSNQYKDFCDKFEKDLQIIQKDLIENKLFTKEKVELKMKKTFKNRYFNLKQFMICYHKNNIDTNSLKT